MLVRVGAFLLPIIKIRLHIVSIRFVTSLFCCTFAVAYVMDVRGAFI